MGRRRPLPRIRAQDQRLRAQAERQAVNFVVQGSAADLCKLAMVHVFSAVAASPTLTARLVAQIHDELLFEVEDAQVPEFAVLVKGCMESVQHLQTVELRLQVPLKVSLSAGRSWGCLAPLQKGPRRPASQQHPTSPAAGSRGCTHARSTQPGLRVSRRPGVWSPGQQREERAGLGRSPGPAQGPCQLP